MLTKDLAKEIERIVRPTFPGVIVRQNRRVPNDGAVPVFDVFCVPDDKRGLFIHYAIRQFGELAEAQGLPEVDLISHCASATQENFPEVWQQWCIKNLRVRPARKGVRCGKAKRIPALSAHVPAARHPAAAAAPRTARSEDEG